MWQTSDGWFRYAGLLSVSKARSRCRPKAWPQNFYFSLWFTLSWAFLCTKRRGSKHLLRWLRPCQKIANLSCNDPLELPFRSPLSAKRLQKVVEQTSTTNEYQQEHVLNENFLVFVTPSLRLAAASSKQVDPVLVVIWSHLKRLKQRQ